MSSFLTNFLSFLTSFLEFGGIKSPSSRTLLLPSPGAASWLQEPSFSRFSVGSWLTRLRGVSTSPLSGMPFLTQLSVFHRHVFHKSCVDPWLSEHCTCPMCKLNILKALGIVVRCPFCSCSLRGVFSKCDVAAQVDGHGSGKAVLSLPRGLASPAHLRELLGRGGLCRPPAGPLGGGWVLESRGGDGA